MHPSSSGGSCPRGSRSLGTTGSPALPSRHWSAGTVTLSMADSTFRLRAEPNQGGWLVAGESVARLDQVRNELLVAEALLGALLLLVTFAGSFVVGLRASAPIEQIRRRQAEFTADASHELRTPLSVIEAEVDLALSRERDAASYQATLRRISSESGRLRSIVEDLLWLARADDADRREDRHQDGRRRGDRGGLRRSLRGRAVAPGSVSLIPRRSNGRLPHPGRRRLGRPADQRPLGQRLPVRGQRGPRRAAGHRSGGQVMLTVDDSGPGIPEAHRELVFDRFHRADDGPAGPGSAWPSPTRSCAPPAGRGRSAVLARRGPDGGHVASGGRHPAAHGGSQSRPEPGSAGSSPASKRL